MIACEVTVVLACFMSHSSIPPGGKRRTRHSIRHGSRLTTAFGVVANFTAGENEATTTDMTVSFLRGVEMGMELELTVYIVKAGRSLIRQRAELTDAATGKLLATASGSWMPV